MTQDTTYKINFWIAMGKYIIFSLMKIIVNRPYGFCDFFLQHLKRKSCCLMPIYKENLMIVQMALQQIEQSTSLKGSIKNTCLLKTYYMNMVSKWKAFWNSLKSNFSSDNKILYQGSHSFSNTNSRLFKKFPWCFHY